MSEVLRTEIDGDHRYRLSKTERGYLLSSQMRSQTGLLIGPAEWLYQTREAAELGLAFVMTMNAYWLAMTRGYSAGDLPARCEAAARAHKEAVERLNDEPLIGQEVRALRTDDTGI